MKRAVTHAPSNGKEGKNTAPRSTAKPDQLRAAMSALSLAEDRERKRLATDLHDNLAQYLTLCRMKLGLLAAHVQTPQAIEALNDVNRYLDDAVGYARMMMSDLHPVLIGDADDLRVAIAWVVDKLNRQGLNVTVQDEGKPEVLDEDLLILAYQSVREVLTYLLKHANASEANLQLRRSRESLDICIDDRGKGWDVSRFQDRERAGDYGLFILKERLELLSGRLETTSALQKGTRIRILIPLKPRRR